MIDSPNPAMQQAVIAAASSIIDNWDDWEGESRQAAQLDQDDRSWRHVMMEYIVSQLRRELDWLAREPAAA